MGYPISKQTIERVRDIFDLVLSFDGRRLEFPAKRPLRTSHAIRAALKSCEHFKETEGKYLEIRDKYKILVTKDKLIFEPKMLKEEVGNPVEYLKSAKENTDMELDNITTLLEAIGATITYKASSMSFPELHLKDSQEIAKCAGWCAKNGYYMISVSPLRLKKNDPNTQERLLEQG